MVFTSANDEALTISAPWITLCKKIYNFFRNDPEVEVAERPEKEANGNWVLHIEITNHQKYLAFKDIMTTSYQFGNVSLKIYLYDKENTMKTPSAENVKIAFKGNPIVSDIVTITDAAQADHTYVVFRDEIIQFFNDDLTDYKGNYNGLAEDIARELFNVEWNTQFCTKDVRENSADSTK